MSRRQPFHKTHAFHRFCKHPRVRAMTANMSPEERVQFLCDLWLGRKRLVPVAPDEAGPMFGEPVGPWTGPDGRQYIFVPGEAP